eukprot:GHVR01160638.1.p1 GENE.GHVR01160638.1~~GHVR01160638.1.p1  ORF type:complete len:126 (-),score=0.30 GHVR01160638.1:392-769(-)
MLLDCSTITVYKPHQIHFVGDSLPYPPLPLSPRTLPYLLRGAHRSVSISFACVHRLITKFTQTDLFTQTYNIRYSHRHEAHTHSWIIVYRTTFIRENIYIRYELCIYPDIAYFIQFCPIHLHAIL